MVGAMGTSLIWSLPDAVSGRDSGMQSDYPGLLDLPPGQDGRSRHDETIGRVNLRAGRSIPPAAMLQARSGRRFRRRQLNRRLSDAVIIQGRFLPVLIRHFG